MSFPAVSNMMARDIYNESATKKCMLGTRIVLNDGRQYVYARAGATGLAVGKLMQSEITDSYRVKDLACPTASAIGATTIYFTNHASAAALTKDELKDGWIFINDATGEGQCRRIKSNSAAAAGATCTVTLYNDEPLTVATVASTTQFGVVASPYSGVLVCPTTLTGKVVGVTPIGVTANYYFWLQVKGMAAVLTDGTVLVGDGVVPSTSVAGAVCADSHVHVENAATAYTQSANTAVPTAATVAPVVGRVRQVAADTEYSLVELDI